MSPFWEKVAEHIGKWFGMISVKALRGFGDTFNVFKKLLDFGYLFMVTL